MFKKLSLIGAALAMTGTAIVPATQAAAQGRYEYRDGYRDGRGYDRGYRQYNRGDRRYSYRAREKCRDGDGGTIVGAIAGETRLGGRDIGAIDIAERFSLVEVPDKAVDEVLWAMRRTTIKGRKVKVRRDRTGH